MKILITNTVALNGGDAAILFSMINLLRSQFGHDTEFIIYDSQAEVSSKYYPELTWRRSIYSKITNTEQKQVSENWLLKLTYKLKFIWRIHINVRLFYLAAWCQIKGFTYLTKILLNQNQLQDLYNYNSADIIVSTGGTYLVENYPLQPRIFDYQISLVLRRPLVFYTQSLGPFVNKQNQKLLKKIFNQSTLILVRDELSLKHLQDLGVSANKIHVSSDVVFAYQSQLKAKNIEDINYSKKTKLKIAISVRLWQAFKTVTVEAGMNNYRSAMCALTQHLVEKYDAEITYISTCQGISEYWTDDSKFALEIYNLLPKSVKQRVDVNNNFHHPETLLEMLTNYDLVIATRMHMCILSLAAGTPVFPIAYEFKTKELFNRLGMKQWVQDIETINNERLIQSIEGFLDNLPIISQNMMALVKQEIYRAINSSQIVKDSLEKWQLK